jgi:hypothetical protein
MQMISDWKGKGLLLSLHYFNITIEDKFILSRNVAASLFYSTMYTYYTCSIFSS